MVWRVPSAEFLFQGALRGGVRTSAALQAQTPSALAAIHNAVITELEQYRDAEGLAIPMPVVLSFGVK